MIISIIFGVGITVFVMVLLQHLGRISKHLRIIRLQLEIQNPMFTSEYLLELEKNIDYWDKWMMRYRNRYSDKDKEINDAIFNVYFAYINRRDRSRKMIAEAKATGDPEKIHDKYEKWLDKNEEEIRKMEDKAKTLDTKIKEDLEKRSLDFEFLGKWDRGEN